jgi:hypothetical protein
MHRSIITTVFVFMGFAVQAQEISVTDSLNLALNKAVTDTSRIHTLIEFADYYSTGAVTKTDLDSASLYLRQAAKLNKEQYGMYFKHRINIFSRRIYCELTPGSDLPSLFLPLIAECKKTGDKLNEMQGWFELATYTIANQKSNPSKLNYYQHALLLAHELNDPIELDCIRSMADIHFQMRQYSLAESELLLILNNPKARRSSVPYITTWRNRPVKS